MRYEETRKQEIARRLGVSVGVLEQYLRLKRAEVMDEGPVLERGVETNAIRPERAREARH